MNFKTRQKILFDNKMATVSSLGVTNQSFSCGQFNITEEEDHIQTLHSWWVQGVALSIFGVAAVIVCIIAVIVLLSDNKLRCILFNKLIISMTCFDLIYLICSIYESIRVNFLDTTDFCALPGYVIVFGIYPLRKITMCCSVYMTVVIAFERFSATTDPIKYRNNTKFSSLNMRTLKYVSIVSVLSLIYGLPLFFAFHLTKMDGEIIGRESGKTYTCASPWFRTNKHFIIIYNNIINLAVTGVIPFIFLAYFYFKIHISIKNGNKTRERISTFKSTKSIGNATIKSSTTSPEKSIERQTSDESRKERMQTIILIWIVISFLICHIPRIALNVEEMLNENERIRVLEIAKKLGQRCTGVTFREMIVDDWYQFLLVVNPLMNIFVYCYFSQRCRDVLRSTFIQILPCCSEVEESAPKGAIEWTYMMTCKALSNYSIKRRKGENTEPLPNEMTPLTDDSINQS